MEYILQTYPSVRNNYVGNTTELSQWVSLIKQSEYSEQIEKARKGLKNYDEVKLSLPCINYPFIFTDYKKNANIVKATGLLYFDIDNPLFDPLNLDLTKVCLYHKSFGGNGYVVVVRVDGMTSETYRHYYKEVAKDLGIINLVDYNAAKQVQTNVLSYDKEVYYNINSKVYTFSPHHQVIKKEESIYMVVGGFFSEDSLCFSNLELLDFEGKDYIVDWGNIEVVKCFVPYDRVGQGKRNNMLLSFANNFVYLNPRAPRKSLQTILQTINSKHCLPEVPESQINRVVDSVWRYKENGTLKPLVSKKKRSIVFHKDCTLSKNEKNKIVGEEIKKHWKNIGLQKIEDVINKWNFEEYGKITSTKIYTHFDISKKVVEKYYKHLKGKVKKLNNSFAV